MGVMVGVLKKKMERKSKLPLLESEEFLVLEINIVCVRTGLV